MCALSEIRSGLNVRIICNFGKIYIAFCRNGWYNIIGKGDYNDFQTQDI